MKRNIIIILVSVLILTCLFVFARTTTTDLGLVKPTWDEEEDILDDLNANSDILEAFANDPLKYDSDLERLEDRVGAMFSGNTETLIVLTYQDADNTVDAVVDNDLHLYSWTNVVDGDIPDSITVTGYMQDGDINTFSELQAWVTDKTLVNEEDVFIIDANWVNTANPWADNEVSDTLTSSTCTGNSATVTVDATTTDTTCFVGIFESASGSLEPQTDATLIYNANTGLLTSTALLINGTTAKGIEITGANTSAQLYVGGTNILANGEQAIYVNCPSEDGATNAMWLTLGSTVVTGDVTGARVKTTTQAASGGDAASGQNVRGIYSQAIAAASKHAGLLQGGLFTADVSAGSVTAYNVHALCGHYSAGASAVIGGDLYVGYLRAQSRSTNSRTVTGNDFCLALENEAVEGTGMKMDGAIRIFDTNVSGDAFTYGIDMNDATLTTDIRLSDAHTITDSATGIAISLLSPTTISGLSDVTSADADYILVWDATDSALKKVDMGEVRGAGAGYTNLTEFVAQTAWRVFYSNTDGDVVELALGANGTYLKSNGAAAAPTFATPAGAGDVVKVGTPVNDQVGVWTGDGTIEGHASFTYASGTGTVTATEFIGGGAGLTGANTGFTSILNAGLYVGRDADNTISFATDNHIIFKTSGATCMEVDSTGELDMNANTVGFTLQTATGDGTTTIDWKLGNKFEFTFGAQNDTFTFTAPTNPGNFMLWIIQDATGSRTITWPATVRWPGGTAVTLSTAANAVDIVALVWNGTNYDCVSSLAFAVP